MMHRDRVALFAIWFIFAALSGPVGILLHELGHYMVALVSGFPEARLSFASASYRDSEMFWQALASGERAVASAIYSIDLAGWVAAAGPAVTALLIIGSVCILLASKPPNEVAAFLAGLALMAGVRSFTGIYYLLAVRPRYPGARPFFDEMNVARALDVSVDWIAWPSAFLVVLAWILVVPRLGSDRWLKLVAAIVGPIVGILVWAQVGPWILP